MALRVTVWNENVHDREDPRTQAVYPNGLHGAIVEALQKHLGNRATIGVATLEQPEHGLTEEVLANTDVLTWWGHVAHEQVDDAVAERVRQRVLSGMGLIVLHSGHLSKP